MDERTEMYIAYCKELDKYDDAPGMFRKDPADVVRKYSEDPDVTWRDIVCCGEIAGFLVTLTVGKPRPITHVAEAYVKPEYRGRGLMRKAVADALKDAQDVSREVYKQNPATTFWKKVMAECGYECVRECNFFLNDSLKVYFYRKKP